MFPGAWINSLSLVHNCLVFRLLFRPTESKMRQIWAGFCYFACSRNLALVRSGIAHGSPWFLMNVLLDLSIPVAITKMNLGKRFF